MKEAIIIGAGPAGLTCAYELLRRGVAVKPVIFEKSGDIGGISKTKEYKGNRIDIGGHRFFSKSDRIMKWWLDIMPLEKDTDMKDSMIKELTGLYGCTLPLHTIDNECAFLVRSRLSRILYNRKFYNYPLSLSMETLGNLGLFNVCTIGLSYTYRRINPIRNENSLEDFFINRFGDNLYKTFFKSYTEKVWGVACSNIKAEWGAQRVKGLSIGKTIQHAIRSSFKQTNGFRQKNVETSLIERFLYPKYGPGQLWEEVASRIEQLGGKIYRHHEVVGFEGSIDKINALLVKRPSGKVVNISGNYFISTMPVKDLIGGFRFPVPKEIQQVAQRLSYRDFITVGLLLKKIKTPNNRRTKIPDTWMYIQEKDVRLGRIQIFNNWSPYLIADPQTIWVGLEYFCYQNDDLWNRTDHEMAELAIGEMVQLGFIDRNDVLDNTVLRVEKTYPAYFGSYEYFDHVRKYTDAIPNLFLIGRNGMHRYNNQDHSMLTAMAAVDAIESNSVDKNAIWSVNTEKDYHEKK